MKLKPPVIISVDRSSGQDMSAVSVLVVPVGRRRVIAFGLVENKAWISSLTDNEKTDSTIAAALFPRVAYLAFAPHKPRTQKKNIARLKREFRRLVKKRVEPQECQRKK